MSDMVDADKIEGIVGVSRHPIKHYGRAVSEEERVYILHSHACLETYDDLRDCPFSEALDGGIHYADFEGRFDQPIILGIDPLGWLVPVEVALKRSISTVHGMARQGQRDGLLESTLPSTTNEEGKK